jgi:hypothetical protein
MILAFVELRNSDSDVYITHNKHIEPHCVILWKAALARECATSLNWRRVFAPRYIIVKVPLPYDTTNINNTETATSFPRRLRFSKPFCAVEMGSQATNINTGLEAFRIAGLPPDFYYIPNFISMEEEASILQKVCFFSFSDRLE